MNQNNAEAVVSPVRAIVAFTLGILFFTYAFTQRVAPSVMTAELMRDFSVGGAVLGSLSAWYFYTYASIQLPVGVLTDRFGPRKLMSVAMLLCGVASLGFAMSDSLLAASVSRALVGVTVGFGFVGVLAIAGYWFAPSRFAMLAGIAQTAGMCGGMLGQAPLRFAVEQVGWRGTMMVMAAVALGLSVLLYWLIPRRPRSAISHETLSLKKSFGGIGMVARNPQSWLCAGVGFGLTAIMLGFVGLWAIPWLSATRELSKPEVAAIASMLFLGWAMSAPVWGWLSDHLGMRKPMLLIGAVGNIVLFSAVIYSRTESVVLLSSLFFMMGIVGSSMTVSFSLMRELNSVEYSGTALGFLNMCVVGAGAVMQPLVGWLLDRNWAGTIVDGARLYQGGNYDTAFMAFYVANLLALGCVIFLRETHCKQVG